MTQQFTKEDYQKALELLDYHGEAGCVYEVGGSRILKSALQLAIAAQPRPIEMEVTKTHENVTCENLSNADERQAALDIVNEQAKDDGLWFVAKYASEAYLQQELRRLHAAVERAALQSPRVPVIDGLDEAMSVINKFIRARDAEIDFLPEKSIKNTSEWISHFMHNVNYSLSFNDWMNLDKVRAYAELQKGN